MITRTSILITFLLGASTLLAQNYKIVNANSGKVLEVQNGATGLGGVVDQWDWNGGAHQQWQIVPLGNGYNEIVNVNSGRVLDVANFSTDNGATIWQWDWLDGPNQQWQIAPQDSSYNAIFNLNSGKVADVSYVSQDNGAQVWQWDWVQGLNQQWQIIPVQDTYQATGYTDIYYDSGSQTGFAVASTDADYSTQYYYGNQISLEIDRNGDLVNSALWGYESDQAGFGSAYAGFNANPGDYIEAGSWYGLVTQYEWYQVTSACGPFCYSWYDPFNYDFVEENPEGTTIPTWYANVWATIVVATIARAASVIGVGHNANAMVIPGGNPSTFDLKFRAFIPPAWIRGPDPCLLVDYNGNAYVASWTIYGGDNRGFDPFSRNYRAHAEGVVSTLTGTWQGGTVYGSGKNPYYSAGTTTRYAGDALAPDGYTLYSDTVYHDCHYTDDVFQEDNSHMSGSASGGSGSVTVNFYGDVNDQTSDLGQSTPGLGYNVTYTLDTNSNPAIPAYSFNYSHKCYPAYEGYIGTQQIYGYRPLSNNPFYFSACLFGGLIITDTTIGAVQ